MRFRLGVTWWGFASVAIALTFLGLAFIDTTRLAQFFTHELLATRAHVAIRPVTIEGAQLFRLACVAAALAWLAIPRLLRGASTSQQPDTPVAFSRRTLLLVCVVLLLGVTERVWRLSESFWFDEISALLDYAQYGPGAIVGTYFVPSNHVLHTLLCWCTISLAGGASEPLLRLPALLAGLAAIPTIVLLVRECARWQGARTGTAMAIGCALATLSPIMVVESVEARGYSMMILFASLASWNYLRAWRTGATSAWICYSIVCALGVWAHLTFVVLPISHGAIALWFVVRSSSSPHDRIAARRALLALVLAAITAFAVLSPLLPDLLRIRSEFQALDGNEPSLFSREGLHVLLGLGASWTLWSAPLGLGLFLLGLKGAVSDRTRRFPLTVTLLALPLIVVGTSFAGSWMYARFALFAMPGVLLAMTLGLCDLRTKRLMTLVAVVLAVAWTTDICTLAAKQPIRDAVLFIREQDRSLTTIASAGLADNVVAYYGVLAGFDIRNAGTGGSNLDTLAREIGWLIVLYPESLTEQGRAALERDWSLVQTFRGWVDWTNGDVLVYCRKQVVTARTATPRDTFIRGDSVFLVPSLIVSKGDDRIFSARDDRWVHAKDQSHGRSNSKAHDDRPSRDDGLQRETPAENSTKHRPFLHSWNDLAESDRDTDSKRDPQHSADR